MDRKKQDISLRKRVGSFLFFFVASLVLAGNAWADGLFDDSAPPLGYTSSALMGSPVSHHVLSGIRGKGGISFSNDAQMTATLGSSSVIVNGNVSMKNSIGGSAFGNSAGVVNVIQNTGSNVVIQNLVQLNLSMH